MNSLEEIPIGNHSFPTIAAHTGCENTPYNTMESFMEGVRLGAGIVEVDLRTAADGTVVLLHDDHPSLHTCTFEQLNELSVRSAIHPLYERHEMVKLDDILQAAKTHNVLLNLDIKTDPAIEPVIELVKRHEMVPHVFITGCSDGITSRHPGVRVVWNTPTKLTPEQLADYGLFVKQVCDYAAEGGYYGLNMQYRTCRQELVEAAHERGLAVWVYTVNERDEMVRLIEAGVDAMTTKQVKSLSGLRSGRESGVK